MADDLWGASHPEEIPPDLADYMLIRKTGIPLHEFFDDDKNNDRDRGKAVALVVYENQRAFLMRFSEIIERNKKAQKRKDSKPKTKAQRKKTQRPRTTNRYRRRR